MSMSVAIPESDEAPRFDLSKWRQQMRSKVTAIKFHVMASRGLTSEGQIVAPYSPNVLLEASCGRDGSDLTGGCDLDLEAFNECLNAQGSKDSEEISKNSEASNHSSRNSEQISRNDAESSINDLKKSEASNNISKNGEKISRNGEIEPKNGAELSSSDSRHSEASNQNEPRNLINLNHGRNSIDNNSEISGDMNCVDGNNIGKKSISLRNSENVSPVHRKTCNGDRNVPINVEADTDVPKNVENKNVPMSDGDTNVSSNVGDKSVSKIQTFRSSEKNRHTENVAKDSKVQNSRHNSEHEEPKIFIIDLAVDKTRGFDTVSVSDVQVGLEASPSKSRANSTPSSNSTPQNSTLTSNSTPSSNSTPQNSTSQNSTSQNSTPGSSSVESEVDRLNGRLREAESEVERLSCIRDEVENELQELTANLFQEAHSMVHNANQRAANAEKSLRESSMQVEVLTAEVTALKALVITSTPAAPNPHLHPQLIAKSAAESGKKIFQRGHRKSPSDFDLRYGRDTTPPSSPLKESRINDAAGLNQFPLDPECWEVDPVVHKEFITWKQKPTLERCDPFMSRIYEEDIDLCLAFPNTTLAHRVQRAIEDNSVFIEEVNPRQKTTCPRKCVLLDVPRFCKYRFRLSESDETWYYISQLARNRIIAICDFLNYLRYIKLGLVKSSVHDVYWEIVKLRRQMALARLGF